MINLICNKNPILEALKSGRQIEKLYMKKGSQENGHIASMAKKAGVPISYVPVEKLDRLTEGKPHQGICAIVSEVEYKSIDQILDEARKKNQPPFIVACDRIYDPHNLGAIIRTANATGVHGVIIPKRRSAPITAASESAAAGALAYVPICKATNMCNAIKELKKQGIFVYGADHEAKTNIYETDFSGGVCIVIGNEGDGLSRLVKEQCDFLCSIPMLGSISSLNASVSAAVMMYEVVRRKVKGLGI